MSFGRALSRSQRTQLFERFSIKMLLFLDALFFHLFLTSDSARDIVFLSVLEETPYATDTDGRNNDGKR